MEWENGGSGIMKNGIMIWIGYKLREGEKGEEKVLGWWGCKINLC